MSRQFTEQFNVRCVTTITPVKENTRLVFFFVNNLSLLFFGMVLFCFAGFVHSLPITGWGERESKPVGGRGEGYLD